MRASGIRPVFVGGGCGDCKECLSFCPGSFLDYRGLLDQNPGKYHPLIGPYLEVWDGYSADDESRRKASSGGALSALSLYCLEKENMESVLHTGMDRSKPWLNRSVRSKTRDEILENAGSRYAPSSPCDSLSLIEKGERPSVFIGKPCDAAAVYSMRRSKKSWMSASDWFCPSSVPVRRQRRQPWICSTRGRRTRGGELDTLQRKRVAGIILCPLRWQSGGEDPHI